MGIINRFLCFVFSVSVGLVSIMVLAAALKILPQDVWVNELKYLMSREEAPFAVGIFILFSIYFILVSALSSGEVKEKELKEISLSKSTGGEVKVTTDAVKNLVERASFEVGGVRGADAVIKSSADAPLKISVKLALSVGSNAPLVTSEAKEKIRAAVEASLSVSDPPIDISVTELTGSAAGKRVV